MNLLFDAWIPVRANGGTGESRLLTYRSLLCEAGYWQVSLPRDDLELACLQLLVCMTQVMFLPESDTELRTHFDTQLKPEDYDAGTATYRDWFDLDHPTQPFMQSCGVKAAESTPIQKLLIGLPEGNNHAFFNETGEVRHLSDALAAIVLFNQASNCPSFGGGFKGSLRGAAPITTLIFGNGLRDTIWRNVLTRARIEARQIMVTGSDKDQPTWIKPIVEKSTIPWNQIGLFRGLFWQPAKVKLIRSTADQPCDLLGGAAVPGYTGFLKEKFNFTLDGVWPHPHGTFNSSLKKGELEQKFASFTTTAPAWTQLSEFVVPHSLQQGDGNQGSSPSGPIIQAAELGVERLNLLIGGYRTKQASVLERRHELISLAGGWRDDRERLPRLVEIGKDAKKALRGKLYFAVQGNKDKGLKGIGAAIHETAEKLFYARTESLIHEAFSNEKTWKEWVAARESFAMNISRHCREIFNELTDPYAMKPELIPVIAWSRRALNSDLKKLMEVA